MAKRKSRQAGRILAPARPWFLKYALCYFLFLCVWFLWFLAFAEQPDSAIAKLLTGLLLLGLIPILWFHKETHRERQFVAFVRLGLMLLICLVGTIISEPVIGVLLVVLSIGGVLMYVIVRVRHRRDESSSIRII